MNASSKAFLFVGTLLLACFAVDCANDDPAKFGITPDPLGGGTSTGAGGATSSSSGNTSSSSGNMGGGTGGAGGGNPVPPALVKIVTADTDIAQAVAGGMQAPGKIADGPFYLTDASAFDAFYFSIVTGSDCDVGPRVHVLGVDAVSGYAEAHGMRLAIPAGQALCADPNFNNGYTFFFAGFKPY